MMMMVIAVLLQAGFSTQGHAAVAPELDLVDAEDQITHEMELEEKHDPQANLNVFKWVMGEGGGGGRVGWEGEGRGESLRGSEDLGGCRGG
jgi:hypothetical protein